MVPTRPGKRGATSPAAICAVKYSAAVLRERKLPSVHRGSQRYTLALKSHFSDIFGSLSIFFQRSRQLRHEVGHFIGELSQKSILRENQHSLTGGWRVGPKCIHSLICIFVDFSHTDFSRPLCA